MLQDGVRLFGTDGVRGKANSELTPDFVMDLARAAGEGLSGPVLVGRDTRRSGEMLAMALQSGFHSVGTDTVDVGILPTAGIAYLTNKTGSSLGAVVSASHNPAEDNGIKFFGGDGSKLSDEAEDRIEARLRRGAPWENGAGGVGMRIEKANGLDEYVGWLKNGTSYTLKGIQVVVDAANGAAFKAAPALFAALGLQVGTFACEPDGLNINVESGATHPEYLARTLRGEIGLVFDGDADRFIAVDEAGIPMNGDVVMAIVAAHLQNQGRLRNDVVVSTVMANLGFKRAMGRLGIDLIETRVGDRYVLEAMREANAALGGEQSGHIIFLDHSSTGDGLLTAIRLLEVVAATGKPLTELRQVMVEYPQVLRNVTVGDKTRLEEAALVWEAVAEVERQLGEEGRVLVRPSGTEPVVRVMVEAAEKAQAAAIAEDLAAVVRASLSAPN
jgi:phosphoglucosamine mutase